MKWATVNVNEELKTFLFTTLLFYKFWRPLVSRMRTLDKGVFLMLLSVHV